MKTKADLKSRSAVLLVMPPSERGGLQADIESAGNTVLTAADCAQAKRTLAATSFIEAVLVSVSLPDGSWYDVVHDVRAAHSHVAVLVCAKRHSRWLRAQVAKREALYVELEPYSRQALLLLLQAATRHRWHPSPVEVPRLQQA